jgi:hypothetical protein
LAESENSTQKLLEESNALIKAVSSLETQLADKTESLDAVNQTYKLY